MERCLEGRIRAASPRPGMARYRGEFLIATTVRIGVPILVPVAADL
jgi:hypothetical protein